MHAVDPGAGQVGERGEVGLGGQPLGLESTHLAGRSGGPIEPLPAHNGTHGRIAGEPFGVVDVLVAGEAAVDRLPQQAEQPVADVLAAPAFGESRRRQGGEAEGIVQLPVGEQPTI